MSTAGLSPSETGEVEILAEHAVDPTELDEPFSRTPRPYLTHDVLQDRDTISSPLNLTHPTTRSPTLQDNGSRQDGGQPRHNASPSRSRQMSRAGSESGSEADDERPVLVKALPPSSFRLRKGLKAGEKDEDTLLTPSQLDDEGRRLPQDYFEEQELAQNPRHQDDATEREILRKRRFAEFLRRTSEVALMVVILVCVLCGKGVLRVAWAHRLELLSHLLTIAMLVLAYPVKLSIVDEHARPEKLWQRFRVPASFDPATVLYPPLLPLLVALSVAPNDPSVVLPNLILGLSSLPQRLFPRSSRQPGFNAMHWLVSIIPLFAASHLSGKDVLNSTGLSSETLVSLYPLHHALLNPLHYLTTTSLLISELHLLSVALINLLLIAYSPQAVILKACLWVGGVLLFVCDGPVLSWNVTLARVPKWKLRRPGHEAEERRSLIDAVTDIINIQRATSAFRNSTEAIDSDADEDEPRVSMKRKSGGPFRLDSFDAVLSTFHLPSFGPHSASESHHPERNVPRENVLPAERPRRNTVSGSNLSNTPRTKPSNTRRSRSRHIHWYLRLTPGQAIRRKWFYATFTYLSIILIVLGPVRSYIALRALHGQEPIGWALGYLFGQIPPLRSFVELFRLQNWFILPPPAGHVSDLHFQVPLMLDEMRNIIGASNARLLLVAYWGVILLIGLLTVFSLTAYVEVDTRRKVFHGVMVAMLSPSIFVDPCYCALALGMALAIFLILEAIRAGQVPPLGSAIGRFVAPYVDGRDLRGPVVVSHIFLLIGCAVPLWFSLASIPRAEGEPWASWELTDTSRETAMVAGVICVGMGDAAASLIGRRYGRHKWLWVGGKSLEGSAAFAAAVTAGLVAVKAWLVLGGWTDGGQIVHGSSPWRVVFGWALVVLKASFCACGASFMEAVLTGANDNVVVPIALWLLVKGVRL